ncbi:hypothetical protein E5Q_05165 [Mixia osmundae IAM 14324]|uniref:Uncharacterized protein n=2 Tax=Mixia osmundae (strain CBS 9802 / IAM 14324 / JCM 22182 / KY 12970) TaxID=764103 RepID=G7E6L9_MIXOS|nr:hypothetical protein E5Q_05165 [Mixia osmundae IAM 14324]
MKIATLLVLFFVSLAHANIWEIRLSGTTSCAGFGTAAVGNIMVLADISSEKSAVTGRYTVTPQGDWDVLTSHTEYGDVYWATISITARALGAYWGPNNDRRGCLAQCVPVISVQYKIDPSAPDGDLDYTATAEAVCATSPSCKSPGGKCTNLGLSVEVDKRP